MGTESGVRWGAEGATAAYSLQRHKMTTAFGLKSLQQPEVSRATEGGRKRCKQMAADHMLFLQAFGAGSV